ncbi:MAG TPA: 2-octaprenyl-6-methoxyphenyl hydroxylase [Steroidobacteraceae bacterium]|nr:2-octaprenyl-6-methoxyphenyl hydroxylase [Steroidobacteraceae bacterium]
MADARVTGPSEAGSAAPLDVDVAIVGGGMVGASLALALRGLGTRVLLIEGVAPGAAAQPSFDDRTTALGNASRRIFDALGVWPDIAPQAAAIRTIHVSDAGRFGFARLRAAEQGIDAFGYVVANRVIGAALWKRLTASQEIVLRVPAKAEGFEINAEGAAFTLVGEHAVAGESAAEARAIRTERVTARLIVAADGAHSGVRAAAAIEADVEDYDQIAIVAHVAADHAHDGTAYERFTPTGPLAVLPLYDGSYGVVWSCNPKDAERVLALDDDSYLRELQTRFGWRAGRFVRVGRRASYPLKLTRAVTTTATRTVLIGNAAQALHPVAGQGFNLGLRDAAMLAEVIASAVPSAMTGAGANKGTTAGMGAAGGGDVGAPELLQRFSQWRAADRSGVTRFTDGLVRLFGSSQPGVGILRNLGLLMFDLAPPAKSALARVSAGFGGPSPRLARGLEVREGGAAAVQGAGKSAESKRRVPEGGAL